MSKCCDTCEYFARFEGVCCNGDSEYRADFTEMDFVCEYWMEKESDSSIARCVESAMKVYVITKGEYSDYYICAVTLDKDKAELLKKAFSRKCEEAMIEEYDTDEFEPLDALSWNVTMYDSGSIVAGTIKVEPMEYNVASNTSDVYYVPHLNKYVVRVRAKDEEHAKKIGLDKIAKYRAEQEGL